MTKTNRATRTLQRFWTGFFSLALVVACSSMPPVPPGCAPAPIAATCETPERPAVDWRNRGPQKPVTRAEQGKLLKELADYINLLELDRERVCEQQKPCRK